MDLFSISTRVYREKPVLAVISHKYIYENIKDQPHNQEVRAAAILACLLLVI